MELLLTFILFIGAVFPLLYDAITLHKRDSRRYRLTTKKGGTK
tara:strand:+ start:141 stop:269 length:129 start_codon:yes stop_codon:yes gene_type:complete